VSGRTLVLGDVHGGHRALIQVLERCNFDPAGDRVVFLGDVADGWPETPACIDELLRIPNLVHLLGNHDAWLLQWLREPYPPPYWLEQGGQATIDAYCGTRCKVPFAHLRYLETARHWFQDGDRMFVHAGWDWYFNPHPAKADPDELIWDRDMWKTAVLRKTGQLTMFREVFIGHSTTTRAGSTVPLQRCEIWNVDTGGGFEGRLSILDADTKEYWQSDVVAELYPEHAGRRRSA